MDKPVRLIDHGNHFHLVVDILITPKFLDGDVMTLPSRVGRVAAIAAENELENEMAKRQGVLTPDQRYNLRRLWPVF